MPHFDAGGKALAVEFGVGADDVGSQPRAFLLVAVLGGGTAPDDAVEVAVDGDLVLAATYHLAHGVADVNLAGDDDEALQGAVPQGLFAVLIREPGEEAVRVGQQQAVDAEVAADSYQPVVLAEMGVGKPEIFI